MSFSKKERKFRAEQGNIFPESGEPVPFVVAIAGALRAEFGNTPSKIKVVARLIGSNERTVKNWFSGRNGPNAECLVELMRHSDVLLQLVLCRSGHEELVKALQMAAAREQLRSAIRTLNDLFGSDPHEPDGPT
ncbi:hypothetical protein NED98_17075 [Sphingomonas sp. MMSM20]|uniref:hypothetical protein n=1 Tax=Sphingomonas lycopersici TaxID=2951807 RepID=UPI0022380183|nr:hypothetical protein [Sphingomonas lycopersici]MCW6531963.1 hypothetical protein [Sphingomonas lycopersici]